MFKRSMRDKYNWIIKSCYSDMYAEAGVNFNNLVENATVNEHGQKEIPFDDYSIGKKSYDSILNFYKGFVHTQWEKNALSFQINLGCSPRTHD